MALPPRMAGIEKWAKGKGHGEVAESLTGKGVKDPAALAAWIKKRAGGKGKFVQRLKGK